MIDLIWSFAKDKFIWFIVHIFYLLFLQFHVYIALLFQNNNNRWFCRVISQEFAYFHAFNIFTSKFNQPIIYSFAFKLFLTYFHLYFVLHSFKKKSIIKYDNADLDETTSFLMSIFAKIRLKWCLNDMFAFSNFYVSSAFSYLNLLDNRSI